VRPVAGRATQPSARLGPRPGEVIDRARPLRFSFDGRPYLAYEGDTIVSALLAGGVSVFSRSFKYHRPRGVLSATFFDPNCTVQVGEEPNVRGAHRRVRNGDVVSPQNVWPSLRYDVKAVNQAVGRFLSAGFYYKTFIKPEPLWPAYQQVLKRFAAGGVVAADDPHGYYDHRYAHVDVVVAGGGPAGIAAALGAAAAGASVLLVEEEPHLGGHLRYGGPEALGLLGELRQEVADATGIEVLTDSVVTGRYDGNWIAVHQRSCPGATERLVKVRAGALVVAAGLIERPYVFAGNDLPGVMLSTAAARLVNLYAVRPGRRAVVLSANAEGDATAALLAEAGVEVAAVLDARRAETVVRASGHGHLASVETSRGEVVAADLLVTATGWTAPTSLLNMAGVRPTYDEAAARFVVGAEAAPGVFATGGLVGDASPEGLVAHGRAVGAEAARAAGFGAGATLPPLAPGSHPALFRSVTHGFVDFSEDVSSKDVVQAAAEGYDSPELAKRYTTATMGPSQGKLELVNFLGVLAEATGRSIGELGTTTWRPPYAPVSLGALAGRAHEPVRYSPIQPYHDGLGAKPLVAAQWIRPDHYGDPEAEVRRVREAVGLIDVTPLGKLLLVGKDTPALLNQLYVNKWSALRIGAVRYGVMCAEDGVVLDDGVCGRLGEDRYLMSTTSSGAGAVWEWVERWLQTAGQRLDVYVTPLTTAYASINVAGPASRTLLSRLVEGVDLSPAAFPYMAVREGSVAGVEHCVLWRIGFTGELSYELHVPAGYGLSVWEALLDAGGDLGVGPFGIEAQRIMRLEKGHLIVGQDTDGLTQAFGAGLDWLVKLDKADFAGKPELVWQAGREDYDRLVALVPTDGKTVPAEASQLLGIDGDIVGRITSSRHSPTLGHPICLARLAHHLATPGTVVRIHLPDGRDVPAKVAETLAAYDPEGVKLRA